MDYNDDDILITQKQIENFVKGHGLKRALSAVHLWGIGVGTVIAGVFFGWNYGLEASGLVGFLVSTALATIFYLIIIAVFSELSALMPYAGGPYAYARKGLGTIWGFLAGMITFIEFLCAAAAVTLSITSYLSTEYPAIPSFYVTISVYIVFLLIDIIGVKESAVFQLIVTILAMSALMIFFIGTSGSAHFANVVSQSHMPFKIRGILPSIPYAIWFYVCIEGITLAAEETKNPQKNIFVGFVSSFMTVAAISISVLYICITRVNWELLRNNNEPLLFVLKSVQGNDPVAVKVFMTLAICSLFASLHGMINGYSRQIFALSRAGYLPKFLGKIHPITKTPYWAIIFSGALGILLTVKVNAKALVFITGILAISMYIIIICSYIVIKSRDMSRKAVWRKKSFILLAIINIILLCLEVYLIKCTPYSLFAGILLLLLIVYYFILGRRFIIIDAPEEIEAKMDNIKIRS